MPDDADTPVAELTTRPRAVLVSSDMLRHSIRAVQLRCAQRFFYRRVYRVELMVASHFLHQLAASSSAGRRILKDDEVAQQIEKAAVLEHTLEHYLQFRVLRRSVLSSRDRAPGLEP